MYCVVLLVARVCCLLIKFDFLCSCSHRLCIVVVCFLACFIGVVRPRVCF